jgi:hypothetical protein
METNTLVDKVRASGYMPKQIKKAMKKPAVLTRKQSLSSADTAKGQSRAYVSRDAMPVSIEPIKSPRSKTLAQLGRSIKRD